MQLEKEWYSYNNFRFTRSQVIWALQHFDLLKQGVWIPKQEESGYVGSSKGRRIKHEATFVKQFRIFQVRRFPAFL